MGETDTISRQAAIDAMKAMYRAAKKWLRDATDDVTKARAESCMATLVEIKLLTEKLSAAQPEPCVNTIDALNESIKHFDDMAEECRRNANIERNDYMDMRDDAAEYRQLSIWLNELKWLRERFQSQPEIIRCKDCKHYLHDEEYGFDWCNRMSGVFRAKPDGFCSWAVMRGGGTE